MITTLEAAPAAARTGDAATEDMVSVTALTKSFPMRKSWREIAARPFQRAVRVTVVDHISFAVRRAEFFGLLGANGAGKTTLFKMLGTHLLPDSGSASVAGHDIVDSPHEVRRQLTPVVADERSLNWRLTARENLELFATLYGISRDQARRRVDDVLETVELESAGSKMVGAFSSGMKQRLLIARALLPRPRVLLLDEPTRSLDPVAARRFRRFLREEITGRQGCTVLLATHNAEEAFELCSRVAVLDHGRLLAVGRMDELMGRVRDDRYHLMVRAAQVDTALALMAGYGSGRGTVIGPAGMKGWVTVEASIADGPDGAAAVLARLTRAAIDVSGIERRSVTLADLLERIIGAQERRAHA